MKTSSAIHGLACILIASGALLAAPRAQAQVETLNPNPTLPAGVGSAGELEGFRRGSTPGAPIGRGIGRVNGADRNPADIMLRELNGTNAGRRTGHAAIRGSAVRAALRVEGLRGMPPVGDGAVYFARRGAYEDALYAPHRGSYRSTVRQPTPAVKAASQR